MNIFEKIASGETTHSDSIWVQTIIILALLAGIAIGYFVLGG